MSSRRTWLKLYDSTSTPSFEDQILYGRMRIVRWNLSMMMMRLKTLMIRQLLKVAASAKGKTDYNTNNQNEGVDEADLIKSDGTHVFAAYDDVGCLGGSHWKVRHQLHAATSRT
jgi:uncharacterized secreted protein with C-terminal beta-propeller domain